LWATFLAKLSTSRDQETARALRWSFEELRVAIFAPELRTPTPVNVATLAAAVGALR
jgi:ATP-dependent helicase HrpA